MTSEVTSYVMGHSKRELRRLLLQAQVLIPSTVSLLKRAGISEGMRVLDLGCGVGDVSLLAADLVGPTGEVLGIDIGAEAVAAATKRAADSGVSNVRFEVGAIEEFRANPLFDMAVGRYVLIHQAEPSAIIRAAAALVKPGGVVAFHEPNVAAVTWSSPEIPLWDLIGDKMSELGLRTLPGKDIAQKFPPAFRAAGLPRPRMVCETPIGGEPGSPLYSWFATTFVDLKPFMDELGISSDEVGDLNTLEERLVAAGTQADSQLKGFEQVGAWAMKG